MDTPQEMPDETAGQKADNAVPANENAQERPLVTIDLAWAQHKLQELRQHAFVAEQLAVTARRRATAAQKEAMHAHKIATAVREVINNFEDSLLTHQTKGPAVILMPDAKVEITAGPVVIGLTRKSRDALVKFHRVSDANSIIYLGIYEDPRIGRPLDLFTAPKNFIATPDDAMYVRIPSLKASEPNGYGHDGMAIIQKHHYEPQIVENLRSGKGLGKWFGMPWSVLAGSDYPGTPKFFADNLRDNWDKGYLVQATWVKAGGSFNPQYLGSVTPNRANPVGVLLARRRPGDVNLAHVSDGRVRWLPVLAQELTL